jgi:uncharacterized membrane protein
MRRAFLALAVTLPVLGGFAAPGQAAFNVCNKTDLATRVALGRFDGSHWTSEGWWTIKPRTCAGLINGPLDSRYYYLYATDSAAGTWEGKTHFCVAPEARFKASSRGSCAKNGLDRRGFFEVDTGKAGDWTQSLSN